MPPVHLCFPACTSMHKFGVGDKVDFVPAFHQRSAPTSEYQIVRQLPDHDGEFFYQIKSAREPHDRVVGESQLVRPAPAAPRSPSPTAKRRRVKVARKLATRPRATRMRKRG